MDTDVSPQPPKISGRKSSARGDMYGKLRVATAEAYKFRSGNTPASVKKNKERYAALITDGMFHHKVRPSAASKSSSSSVMS